MIDSENRINELNTCIQHHVDDVSTWLKSCELRVSSNCGCGVFATRDIEPNELLFGDKPLILGPTGNKMDTIVCVMCYERIGHDVTSHLCSNRCGLVLCGESACAERHKNECELLQNWKPKNPNELSFTRLKAMLIIRSLILNVEHKKFLGLMQKNYTSWTNEIYFDKEFDNFPRDKETVAVIRDASAAINANAFMILYRSDNCGDVNVRSFYPIMSLINHNCVPNARHDIDSEFVNRIFAARPIKKGEQIFISYAQILWGTPSRRMFTAISKQFQCTCERCADPTEKSTYLSAIRCVDKSCNGMVLPLELSFKTEGKCNVCGKICDNKRLLQTQDMSAAITKNFLNQNFTISDLKHFMEGRLYKLVPECNQFVVEAKLKAIWKCDGMSFEDLSSIKGFCEDILRIMDKLGLGECSLKGYLAHRLFKIRQQLKIFPESSSSHGDHDQAVSEIDTFLNDDDQLWKTAKIILGNSSAAPTDINRE
ncbi:SET domain-containing protein SmydA-8 [Sitodiplosis mosellana]|uniref:SET domain-containing protein SmydA-8 n=1 Tax=Sitodiplosis mosellana TaxID=263140 RepID=UPI002444897E|nr:SET domain-containing protein SmydA-8 [Sitodiplosis mosellana]